MSKEILSPMAMFSYALRFGRAAARLQGGVHVASTVHPVTHYLYGHSIELGLKAFLLAAGQKEGDLRKLGHDLRACLQAAEKAGLADHVKLTKPERTAIAWLNEFYEKKELEYAAKTPEGGRITSYPSTAPLQSACSKLAVQLRPVCFAALRKMRGKA
jgi:hypothetical protein